MQIRCSAPVSYELCYSNLFTHARWAVGSNFEQLSTGMQTSGNCTIGRLINFRVHPLDKWLNYSSTKPLPKFSMAPVSCPLDLAPAAAASAQFIPFPGIGPRSNSKCQLSGNSFKRRWGVWVGKYFTVIGTFGKSVFVHRTFLLTTPENVEINCC